MTFPLVEKKIEKIEFKGYRKAVNRGGGEKGTQQSSQFSTGGSAPSFKPYKPLQTIFDKKRHLFHIPSN